MDTPLHAMTRTNSRYIDCPWCGRAFDLWKLTNYKVYAMLVTCPACHRPIELTQKVSCTATPVTKEVSQ